MVEVDCGEKRDADVPSVLETVRCQDALIAGDLLLCERYVADRAPEEG